MYLKTTVNTALSWSPSFCVPTRLFVFLTWSSEDFLFPPVDHCQWESSSNPCCCLDWHHLTLPLHICMSRSVSAKVPSDVMVPDGSIVPADRYSSGIVLSLCVHIYPLSLQFCIMGLCLSWLVTLCTCVRSQWGLSMAAAGFWVSSTVLYALFHHVQHPFAPISSP